MDIDTFHKNTLKLINFSIQNYSKFLLKGFEKIVLYSQKIQQSPLTIETIDKYVYAFNKLKCLLEWVNLFHKEKEFYEVSKQYIDKINIIDLKIFTNKLEELQNLINTSTNIDKQFLNILYLKYSKEKKDKNEENKIILSEEEEKQVNSYVQKINEQVFQFMDINTFLSIYLQDRENFQEDIHNVLCFMAEYYKISLSACENLIVLYLSQDSPFYIISVTKNNVICGYFYFCITPNYFLNHKTIILEWKTENTIPIIATFIYVKQYNLHGLLNCIHQFTHCINYILTETNSVHYILNDLYKTRQEFEYDAEYIKYYVLKNYKPLNKYYISCWNIQFILQYVLYKIMDLKCITNETNDEKIYNILNEKMKDYFNENTISIELFNGLDLISEIKKICYSETNNSVILLRQCLQFRNNLEQNYLGSKH